MKYLYSVIIPHYNDVSRLEKCLNGLLRNDTAQTEIVVVDNMSTETMDTVIAKFPEIRFVREPEKGAALARNRGVRETTSPRLFFLDADCVPADDWLATAKQVCDQSDLVGGRVNVFDETPPPRSGSQALEAVFAFDFQTYVEKKGFAGTGNLLTRRDIIQDVGGFINGLSEDRDWCHRAHAKGYSLSYQDGLRVGHPSRTDWPALKNKWRRLTREAFALNGTGTAARLRWGLRALAMPLSAIAHSPRILRSPKLNSWTERWRGLVTLFRLRMLRCVWMLKQVAGFPI